MHHPSTPGVAAADYINTSLHSTNVQLQAVLLHAVFMTGMRHYIGIPTSRIPVFKLGREFAVFPNDAVATGEVNYYNFGTSTVCGDNRPAVAQRK